MRSGRGVGAQCFHDLGMLPASYQLLILGVEFLEEAVKSIPSCDFRRTLDLGSTRTFESLRAFTRLKKDNGRKHRPP